MKKRKVFDSSKMRAEGTEINSVKKVGESSRRGAQKVNVFVSFGRFSQGTFVSSIVAVIFHLLLCPISKLSRSYITVTYNLKLAAILMYGSAGLLALFSLGLSRGIVSRIYLFVVYIECTAIHNAHLWVPLQERYNMTNIYKIFTFITTIIFYVDLVIFSKNTT